MPETPRAGIFSLHVDTPRTWRGGQNQTLLTVRGLRALGQRAALVPHPKGELRRRAADDPDVYPLAISGDLDVRAAWKLSRLLHRLQPRVVHAQDAHAVAVVALARSLSRLTPPSRFVVSRRVDFHIRQNVFSRWKYSQVELFLCASDAIRSMLIDDGVAAERTTTVHDGVKLKAIAETTRHDTHAMLGLPPGVPLVGNVAALVPHKGHRFLIEAAAHVVHQFADVRFVIIGEGQLEHALRRQISDLHLERHVLLTGFRSDAQALLKGFDVFAMSSVTEGMGSVLLEAMATGQPIVATRAGGIPEVVTHERTGLLVPPRDARALAAAIITLLRDPTQRTRLGAAALHAVQTSFSVERMVRQTLDAYARLVDRPHEAGTDHPAAVG